MSAVVLALSTPLFAVADAENGFVLRDVPPGDYSLHVWIEGAPPSFLEQQTRRMHLASGMVDLGQIAAPASEAGSMSHTNKFGKPARPSHPQFIDRAPSGYPARVRSFLKFVDNPADHCKRPGPRACKATAARISPSPKG
jgi:hypothetical protein